MKNISQVGGVGLPIVLFFCSLTSGCIKLS